MWKSTNFRRYWACDCPCNSSNGSSWERMLALVWKQFLYVSLLMVLVGPFRGPFFYHQLVPSMPLSIRHRIFIDLHCMSRSIGRKCTCKMIFNLSVCRCILLTELHPDPCCTITLGAARCYPHHLPRDRNFF